MFKVIIGPLVQNSDTVPLTAVAAPFTALPVVQDFLPASNFSLMREVLKLVVVRDNSSVLHNTSKVPSSRICLIWLTIG